MRLLVVNLTDLRVKKSMPASRWQNLRGLGTTILIEPPAHSQAAEGSDIADAKQKDSMLI